MPFQCCHPHRLPTQQRRCQHGGDRWDVVRLAAVAARDQRVDHRVLGLRTHRALRDRRVAQALRPALGARVGGERGAVVEAAVLGRDLEVPVRPDRGRVVGQPEAVRAVAGHVDRRLTRLVAALVVVVEHDLQVELVVVQNRVGQVAELVQPGEQAREFRRVRGQQLVDLRAGVDHGDHARLVVGQEAANGVGRVRRGGQQRRDGGALLDGGTRGRLEIAERLHQVGRDAVVLVGDLAELDDVVDHPFDVRVELGEVAVELDEGAAEFRAASL